MLKDDAVMAYAVPLPSITPEMPGPYNPLTNSFPPVPVPIIPQVDVALVDRALLREINSKLDELLRRTSPGADVVEDIRKRVNEALDKLKGK